MTYMDKLIKRIGEKVKPQWRFAFWGCVVAGLLMHMYPMTHHFLTGDSLWNQYSTQDMISSGRQFLTYACGISSYYDLPWVNGILSVLYLALTAIVVVESLEIKGKICAALTGILLVSFPVIVSTFCYAYTIDGYMLAVLLSATACLITHKYKWGFLPGMIMVGIALGIYQGYYSFTILLCILCLMKDALSERKGKEFVMPSLRYMAMGVGGYLFYVITLKLMLLLKGVSMSGYQGTDRILQFTLSELPRGIIAAIKTFGSFALESNVMLGNTFMKTAYFVLVFVGIGMYCFLFIKKKAYKDILKVVMVLLLVALIPVGTTIVSVLSPDSFFHLLMRYPWVLFFIFVLVLTELVTEEIARSIPATCLSAVTVAATLVMIFCFAVNGNIAYFNLNEKYEKTYSYALRIADTLEETPGYRVGDKVIIVGGIPTENYYPYTDITSKVMKGYFGPNGNILTDSTDKYQTFMARYLNVTIEIATPEEEIAICATEEFLGMPRYPKKKSIQKINGIWVVKVNG